VGASLRLVVKTRLRLATSSLRAHRPGAPSRDFTSSSTHFARLASPSRAVDMAIMTLTAICDTRARGLKSISRTRGGRLRPGGLERSLGGAGLSGSGHSDLLIDIAQHGRVSIRSPRVPCTERHNNHDKSRTSPIN
jgi:hypothetical protein